MSSLAHIQKVIVPSHVAAETQRFLQTVGRRGMEGLVLWVGSAAGGEFHVTQPLIPKQRGIRTADGVCAVVDSNEMHRINVELYKTGLRLIGQVHSHPTDAYHSDTDDQHAIANIVGCLSLVIPDFGAGEFNLANTAVYRLAASGDWLELDQMAAAMLIKLV